MVLIIHFNLRAFLRSWCYFKSLWSLIFWWSHLEHGFYPELVYGRAISAWLSVVSISFLYSESARGSQHHPINSSFHRCLNSSGFSWKQSPLFCFRLFGKYIPLLSLHKVVVSFSIKSIVGLFHGCRSWAGALREASTPEDILYDSVTWDLLLSLWEFKAHRSADIPTAL